MDDIRPIRPTRPVRSQATRRSAGRVPRFVAIAVAVVVVLLIVLYRVLGVYVDWLWFGEVALRVAGWRRALAPARPATSSSSATRPHIGWLAASV